MSEYRVPRTHDPQLQLVRANRVSAPALSRDPNHQPLLRNDGSLGNSIRADEPKSAPSWLRYLELALLLGLARPCRVGTSSRSYHMKKRRCAIIPR